MLVYVELTGYKGMNFWQCSPNFAQFYLSLHLKDCVFVAKIHCFCINIR